MEPLATLKTDLQETIGSGNMFGAELTAGLFVVRGVNYGRFS